tara:strand:+ start:11182 stop:12777 length:1596 start_codon:yes stop_codon:yes gene_type:complete
MPITFDLLFNTASIEVTFSDTTDYTGYTTPVHGVVSIVSTTFGALNTPGTNLVPDITIPTGDFSPSGQASRDLMVTTALPASGTTPFNGDWTVAYSIYDDAGAGTVEVAITKSFTFAFTSIVPALSIAISNIASQVTSTDSTDYLSGGLYTLNSETKAHSVYAPLGALDSAGAAIPSPANTGSSSVITYTGITTGIWTSQVTNTYSVELNTGMGTNQTYSVRESIQYDASSTVSSSVGLCNVYCCLKALNTRYEEAKCMNKSLAENYKNKIEDVTRLVTLYNQSVTCGLNDDADGYLTEIKNISECNTECDCYGVDGAPALVPIVSGTSSVSYELAAASSNLRITSTGTGTSADPIVYEIDLGTVVAGNINYVAENLNAAKNELAAVQAKIATISTDISALNSGVIQQVYDLSINSSASTIAVTPLFTSSYLFDSTTVAVFDNIGDGNFDDLNCSFTVSDMYIVVNQDSFSLTPNTYEDNGLKVDVVSKSSTGTGSFVFRLLDSETNQPVTNRNLSNYASNINITFRIITK